MANETNETGGTEPTSVDVTNKFISSLILNLIIAVVCLVLFCMLRRKHQRIYSPRQLLLETPVPVAQRTPSIFSWILPAFFVKDSEVFQYAGIDALVHMRFLKLCFKISLVLLPYGLIVLIPINYFGGEELQGLDRIALSNIKLKSSMVWAHVVAAWLYTLIICYLFHQEWKAFISYRQQFLRQGFANQYAVLVRDLPAKLKDTESLKKFVQEMFPDQVEDVVVVEDLTKWQELVDERNALKWKLEHANAVHEKTGEKPTHKKFICCGTKYDSITQFGTELEAVQAKLDEETAKDHSLWPCSFVVFRSLRTSTVAAQADWDQAPLTIDVMPAPEFVSVLWKNLSIGLFERKVRTVLVYGLVFLLVFFWTVPVAFVSTLVSLQNLTKVAPFLKPVLELSAFVKGAIEGFMSSLALMIFFAILPLILQLFSKLEGIPSQSEVDRSVLGKLFIFMQFRVGFNKKIEFKKVSSLCFALRAGGKIWFVDWVGIETFICTGPRGIHALRKNAIQVEVTDHSSVLFTAQIVNKFLFLTFAGSAVDKLKDMLDNPSQIPAFLAEALPSQSVFFICYIMLATLTGYALQLLRIFANHLFILIVGLSYSALAPIITPFVALYFGFGYVVWMHQTLSVYIPVYTCGGMMWPRVFNRMIIATVVFQLLMVGVIGLKQSFAPSALLLPLPVITVLFYFFILQHYIRPAANLSLQSAHALKDPAPIFVQGGNRSDCRFCVNHKTEFNTESEPSDRIEHSDNT
ncbi:CSC1-like protein ERD4 [Acropora cervicornis]|uniref:CSC1-like protein ERD4 n=1 Tax=Acropora cervicornis TaxID=6130 RepID=A0AAD9QLV7_ACRCE|nr:CSC1-like protein ERD4 [Acropora cervicornis]